MKPVHSTKAIITSDSVGSGSTGVLPIQRLPGITPAPGAPTVKPKKPKK